MASEDKLLLQRWESQWTEMYFGENWRKTRRSIKWPFQLAQFSRTQGVALEVTSYKVPASASASFNVCSIVTCLIANGRHSFVLILSPAFPPTSDDFEASYAVTLRVFVGRRWYVSPENDCVGAYGLRLCNSSLRQDFLLCQFDINSFLKAVLWFTLILSVSLGFWL